MDELAGITVGIGRRRVVEESEVADRVRRADVQQQAERTIRILPAGRLEDLAGHLVDLRVAVGAEGRVAGDGAEPSGLGVDEIEPRAAWLRIDERVALDPLRARGDAAVLLVDQRS